MKKILIADANKSSLVMTSEVFKDNYVGIQVLVAKSFSEVLAHAEQNGPTIDAFVIDFDLPERDGIQTTLFLKGNFTAPIILTAFDSPEISATIQKELSLYPDCQNWLKKPVTPQTVVAAVERFCTGKIRLQKRLPCHISVRAQTHLGDGLMPPVGLPFFFTGFAMDCSLSGVKIKPHKEAHLSHHDWEQIIDNLKRIPLGHKLSLTFTLPSLENSCVTKGPAKKEENFHGIIGKISWINVEKGEWSLGVELENVHFSEKLFKFVLSNQTKRKSPAQNQPSLRFSKY